MNNFDIKVPLAMQVGVTGGLGFIGSNFIEYLLRVDTNASIINLDKETYAANSAYLSGLENNSRYKFVKCDISKKDQISKYLKDVDIIVNFAAETHVDRSISNSDDFIQSNYVGVKNLLQLSTERDIRFHQISTDEVFGSLSLRTKQKFTERTKYNPRNPYSATKAAADMLISAFANTYGTRVTISYSGNNFGPHQHPEKLIPKTIIRLYNDKKIPIYGTGKQVRDWIYVEDHCSAIYKILKGSRPGERYLISAGNELTNLEVISKVADIMGIKGHVVEYVPDRLGHDIRYSSDSSLIRKKLGWEPAYIFDEALKITVSHYLNNLYLYSNK